MTNGTGLAESWRYDPQEVAMMRQAGLAAKTETSTTHEAPPPELTDVELRRREIAAATAHLVDFYV